MVKFEHPSHFNTTFDTIQWVKRSIYYIARLRTTKVGANFSTRPIGLGTGILVRNRKLITCAHVINNCKNKNSDGLHQDNDVYLLIHQDEMGTSHIVPGRFKMHETLHVHQENDLAILTLPENFYPAYDNSGYHAKLSMDPRYLGHKVAVLGYPMQKIHIESPNAIGCKSICLRADEGVVNQMIMQNDRRIYEFTMPFYPGNSGGPIVDARTGEVFAMVQSYRCFLLQSVKMRNDRETDITGAYSVAYSLNMSEKILREHQILD